jgi:signal transduction histidine kinase
MVAVTIDLALAIAALVTALALWVNRTRIQPAAAWEKLMAGASLLSFALVARLSDVFWARLPWPAFADPLLQQALVLVGLAGGTLAAAAGVAEWVPGWLEQAARARWRARWSDAQLSLDRVVWQAESAAQIVRGLTETLTAVCETGKVYYCARIQKSGEFVRPTARDFTADELAALQKLSSQPSTLLMRTLSGWLLALPVKLDRRLYGAVLVHRDAGHLCFSEAALLEQSAALAALAMGTLIARVRGLRQAHWLATQAALEQKLGASVDPTSDLMGMLDVLRQKLNVDYACVLAYEGEGEYARRYSRLWDPHGLSERGLQVATGAAAQRHVQGTPHTRTTLAGTLPPVAALPHRDMAHHASVLLTRGPAALGLLVVASRRTPLGHAARYQLHRSAGLFTAAVERIGMRWELNQMSRRLSGLGRLAGFGAAAEAGQDYLVTRMLDEIPGTFCQFMRIVGGHELRVEYRRARRGNFGVDTTGRRLALDLLPTCRMVAEAGRSVVFRQDDPERQFEATEAQRLFGAEPNSILMVPVTHEGQCTALLAVGEMRETRRHTFSVADRRYADTFSRLSAAGRPDGRHEHLGSLGDLNLSFASPLTGILGSVEILRQKIAGHGPHEKYLDVIEKNASRIRAKVGELADLAASDSTLR